MRPVRPLFRVATAAAMVALAACSDTPTESLSPELSARGTPLLSHGSWSSVVLQDDFESGALDPAKWTVNTTAWNGASVVITGGQAVIKSRGHLVTAQQFDPEALGGIRITGEWTMAGSTDDFLQILTRSDGVPNPSSSGETQNGVEFHAYGGGSGNLTIVGRGGANVTDLAGNGPFAISHGTKYRFEITDDGTDLRFTLTNTANPAQTRTVTAKSTFRPSVNRVVFHNRENFCCGLNYMARLDNVVISAHGATPAPLVFTSGAGVTTWNPILPSAAYSPWSAPCTAAPAVGPNDARWTNPHPAFVATAKHPWESPTFASGQGNFDASWINAWKVSTSDYPGVFDSDDSGGPGGHNWTKYSTTVSGNGAFVLQFLADNCSWIYVDDTLVGYQDHNWDTNGSGKYAVNLSGEHTLTFVIYDGGGAAGGKFRLETTQSFVDNGGDTGQLKNTDSSPPVITPLVTGMEGTNGWYRSNVTVNWSVADPESSYTTDPNASCGEVVVSQDTHEATITCTAASAGGTASKTVTIKRDATNPLISGAASTTAWTNSSVTVTFSCSDATSGIAACASPVVVSGEGANQSVSGSATDNAGNSASTSVSGINIDKTAPVISYTGNAGIYTIDQKIEIFCSASDALSGTDDDCDGISGRAYTMTAGTHSLSATAKDRAGNKGSGSTGYTVAQPTPANLCAVVRQVVTSVDVQNGLCDKLAAMAKAKTTGAKEGPRGAFKNQVNAQTGKSITAGNAEMLLRWVDVI